jgi:hypothetical protein
MLIEVDSFKKDISGYSPKKSELFHKESGKLADGEFISQLKTSRYKKVVFMAGGTASGKTEFATSYLNTKDRLVYDGTLKNYDGFKVKLDKIKRYAKNKPSIRIIFILPEQWIKAFEVFLSRERQMALSTFFETHTKSALAVSDILKTTRFRVDIYVSRFDVVLKKLQYIKLAISRRRKQKFLQLISETMKNRAQSMGVDF